MPQGQGKYSDFYDVVSPPSNKYSDFQDVISQPPSHIVIGSSNDPFKESIADMNRRSREARQKEFEQKPLLTQWGERAYDALARGGGDLSRMARQTLEAGMGVAQGINSGDFSPVPIEGWRKFESQRNAELQSQREGRPSSLATDTIENIIEASGPAALGGLLTAASGGGLPAAMAVGGGMSAAGADWNDPKRAITQTAIGAIAPVAGGAIGSKVGGAVASRLARPAAQAASRIAGEVGGGSLGNVLGTGAEELINTGHLDPRQLTKAGIVGAAISTPGAIGASHGPLTVERVPFRDAPVTTEMPAVELQGPVRATQEIPSRVTAEDAPTTGLPEISTGEIPSILEGPPGLTTGESPSLRVRTGPTPARISQGPGVDVDLSLTSTQPQPGEWSGSGKAIGNVLETIGSGWRTIRTAFDLSAPFNQGMFLSRAHPFKSIQAFGQMLKSLSPTESQTIDDGILNDPYKLLGDQFDLHISTGGPPEEAFMLKKLNEAPGIAASERTYRTYLDSLRLSVWKSYVDSLQADGFTPESDPMAYKQAAEFINIATGRGSLKPGGKLEGAMGLAGVGIFAPRNLISKFQLLDPVRYATLAPGARKLVLRDALTSFGTVLGTAALLHQAGLGVSLDPRDDDFLTVRWGNHRYDLTGGLKTEVKFLAKMLQGITNQITGAGNLPYQDPLSVAGHYARGKLAPLPGFTYDELSGRDYTGQLMRDKSGLQIAVDSFGPMVVQDLYDGFKDSGWEGLAKSLPSIVGQKVSVYPDKPKAQWLNEPLEFRSEQQRFGEPRSFIEPHRANPKDPTDVDETVEEFSSRNALADSWLQRYGRDLANSDEYHQATPDQQKASLDLLKKRIVSQSSKDEQDRDIGSLLPEIVIADVKEAEQNRQERREEKRAIRPQRPSPPQKAVRRTP